MSNTSTNVSELARKKGLHPSVVHNRLGRGWSLEDALNTPARLKRGRPRKTRIKDQPPVAALSFTDRFCKRCFATSVSLSVIVVFVSWWMSNL